MKIICSGCLSSYNLEGSPDQEFRCRCGNKITIPKKEMKDQFGVVCCSGCWTRYAVAGRKTGAKFKCKRCNNTITIRNTGTTAPEPAVGGAIDNAPTQIIDASTVKGAKKAVSAGRAGGKGVGKSPSSRADIKGRSHARSAPRTASTAKGRPSSQAIKPPAADAAGEQATELKRRMGALERELGELRPKTAELEKERNAFSHQIKEKNDLLSAKNAEISALNNRLAEAQKLIKDSTENIAKLQGALDTANEDIKEFKGTIAARDKEITALKERVSSLEEEAARLNKELETRVTREETERYHTERQETEEKVSAIAEEVAATREALSGVLSKADGLTGEIRSLQGQAGHFDNLPDITAELASTREARDSATKERDSLRERINELETVLGEIQHQIEIQEEEPQSVWQRGAARLFGLFGNRETQATRTPPPIAPLGEGGALTSEVNEVVMPEEVEELGEDMPPEPIPIEDDEFLGDAPPPPPDDSVVVGLPPEPKLEAPKGGVDAGSVKTDALPRVSRKGKGKAKASDEAAAAKTARKRRRTAR